MAKNIVLLCDGTSNEISKNRTSILRLYGTLAKDEGQTVFYDPGVGTFGAENALSQTWRKTVELYRLATGRGIDDNVKEAYRFLIETYDDGRRAGGRQEEPDRIFLFGFSRGAYTARMLAGFIHAVGLMSPVNLNLLDYAYRAYKNAGTASTDLSVARSRDPKANPLAEVDLFCRILRPRRPPIRCLGLFDTVGSIIELRRYGRPYLRAHAFTEENDSVEAVRHAVAIDERRRMYRPQLWKKGGEFWDHPVEPTAKVPQDVKEVWFSGVHGDIGGGYDEAGSALAKIPLAWMIDETERMGLRYNREVVDEIVLGRNPAKDYVAPDPTAAPHDSMNLAWRILEYLPGRRAPGPGGVQAAGFAGWHLPRGARRSIPEGATIHRSVLERRGTPADYPQPNIPAAHDLA